jgi:cell division protein FtsQ
LTRWVFAVMVLTAVVSLADWVARPSVTPLKVARIEGDLRYLKRADLEKAVAEATRGGFFTVDLRAIKEAAEALPWVARISVRRIWPDTLHIWVMEQVPLARWGEVSLINAAGEVFTPQDPGLAQGLPYMEGPNGSGVEIVQRFRQAQKAMRAIGLTVQRVRLSNRQAWVLETDEGIKVRLGVGHFHGRLERFVRYFPVLRSSRQARMNSVDMRYDNGIAVQWEELPEGMATTS